MKKHSSDRNEPFFLQRRNSAGYEVFTDADGMKWIRGKVTDDPPKLVRIDNPRKVFREFSTLSIPESYVAFANAYGMLGLKPEPNKQLHPRELMHEWLGEVFSAKRTSELWKHVKNNHYNKIREHWKGMKIYSDENWQKMSNEELLTYATIAVENTVNVKINNAVTRHFYQGRLLDIPSSLLSALWLGFAQEVAGIAEEYRCAYCGEWFARGAGSEPKRRADAKTCKDTHTWNLSNQRRLERKQTTREVSSDTIKNRSGS